MNNSVAMCAIIKDEREGDILEWVDHHLVQGISHFYLYDNGIGLMKLFEGVPHVTVHNIPGRCRQLEAYYHCSKRFEEDWCCFFDVDEFYNGQRLPVVLEGFGSDTASVSINWKGFGSSGLLTSVPGTRKSSFKKFTLDEVFNRHVKSIIRRRPAVRWFDPHHAEFSVGYQRHISGPVMRGPHFIPVDWSIGCINHYYTGSRMDWETKMRRGRADTGQHRTLEEFYAFDKGCS